MFFPDDPVTLRAAQRVCFGCTVRAACLAEGLDGKETGVWGGSMLLDGRPINRPLGRGRVRGAA